MLPEWYLLTTECAVAVVECVRGCFSACERLTTLKSAVTATPPHCMDALPCCGGRSSTVTIVPSAVWSTNYALYGYGNLSASLEPDQHDPHYPSSAGYIHLTSHISRLTLQHVSHAHTLVRCSTWPLYPP